MKNNEIMIRALEQGLVVPAFNIPYLPMMEPIMEATNDEDAFCFVAVARLEWEKFESKSMAAVANEFYALNCGEEHVRLHLDHIPVVDEDYQNVQYLDLIKEAIDLGYQSVMVDGSRLPFERNVKATRAVTKIAHEADIPVEAELGAVMGHEANPTMSYEEILATRVGFTDPDEAQQFVKRSSCDWLSVAFGNIHGAVSDATRHQKKVAARLDIDHLRAISNLVRVPLVLHGGSGISQKYILDAITNGIAKINIGTEIRQVYEQTLKQAGSVKKAQQSVYERTTFMLHEFLNLSGKKHLLV